MIGMLRGIVIEKQPPFILLEVNGVGYEIQAPMSTFYFLEQDMPQIALYIHSTIRDEAFVLYGFNSKKERELFRQLIKVNGVGPKLALTILSGMAANELVQAIMTDDVSSLVKLPGIGKKTAQRLCIELRDRFNSLDFSGDIQGMNALKNTPFTARGSFEDAVSALVALGYKFPDAKTMVTKVHTEKLAVEEVIRLALKGGA
jgi:Holliday junction DNA helicase RuvA